MRDYQRSKLYKWERIEYEWDDIILTLDQCQQLASSIVPFIEVTDGRARRSPCAKYSTRQICMPKFSRTKWSVIHECAHFIERDKHGPRFVGAYIKLLSEHYSRDIDQLKDSASEFGLDFS